MDFKFLIIIVLLTLSGVNTSAQTFEMQALFNGKNLDGWIAPEQNIWWKANDGILSVKSGPDKKGSILWTLKNYSNFILEMDFLMGAGTVDSGIFLRSDQQQIQIGISGSLNRDMTGSPYIPGKGYPFEASGVKDLLNKKDWNTIKVEAVGYFYKVWLNGQLVLEYESEDGMEKGPIGLQLHANRDMAIDFRNIRVEELSR